MNITHRLNKITEKRGDLYVVENEKNTNLKYSSYYVIDNTTDFAKLNKPYSIIVIRGSFFINNYLVEKGIMIESINTNAIHQISDDFVALIMSNSKYDLPIISGIQFDVRRIFFVDNMSVGSVRGEHAHSEETEFLYSVEGEFNVEIKKIEAFSGIIKKGDSALSLPCAWTSVKNLSEGGILLAFLSHKYDASGFTY